MINANVSLTDILKQLLDKQPSFHGKDGNKNWAIQPPVLEWMINNIARGGNTIETGCGYTTVIFSILAGKHTVISPSSAEHNRIREWCQQQGITLDHVDMIPKPSQDVLPGLDSKDFDFVLIDGDHAFPGPFIDWFYMAEKVKNGGLLAVDDTQITTGKILRDFLMKETPRWTLVTEIGKTAIFRRITESKVARGIMWSDQPYNQGPKDGLGTRIINKIKRLFK